MPKFRKKIVPKTTNNITTGIVNFLINEGHSASRVNVQGQWDEVRGLWRPSKSRKGFADIDCVLRTRYKMCKGSFIGVSLKIEVKKGDDEMSEEQIKFRIEVLEAGGLYFIASDVEHFVWWYNLFIKNNYL